jgi:phage FluMu protein Com
MPDEIYRYIWRCARCSYHFANISIAEGVIKQEKKCPKCKSLNVLKMSNQEIFIECKLLKQNANGFFSEMDDTFNYSTPSE